MALPSETPSAIPRPARIHLAELKDARGRIGKQGFTAEGVKEVLRSGVGLEISEDASLREVVEELRRNDEALVRIRAFLEAQPIEVTTLPDGTKHLQDGHHRGFIADQIAGMESLPVK